jgi:hypothetical protein
VHEKTNEDVIKEAVTLSLNGYKNLNDNTLKNFSSEMDLPQIEQFDVQVDDFLKSYFKGFDYTIDQLEITSESASINLTITCKSFSDFESLLKNYAEGIGDLDSEEMKSEYGKYIIKAADTATLTNFNISMNYYKNNEDIWTNSENLDILLANAILNS